MLTVDYAYAQASNKTRQWAEQQVRRRFREVYGAKGDQILDGMCERMRQNIASDNPR